MLGLSDREAQITQMMLEDMTLKQIGEVLGLSHKTVSTYKSRVYKKLQVNSIIGVYKLLDDRPRYCHLCQAAIEDKPEDCKMVKL
jgi:DNA-binding CsgD family transcriptional regulator